MRLKTTTRRGYLVLAFVCLSVCSTLNCAVLLKRNRVLTGLLDEHLAPASPVAQAALAPLAMPVGLTALAVDGALLPVRHIPDALKDANTVFRDVPFAGVGEILVFPMRVLTYPVIFVGSIFYYTTIPIDW